MWYWHPISTFMYPKNIFLMAHKKFGLPLKITVIYCLESSPINKSRTSQCLHLINNFINPSVKVKIASNQRIFMTLLRSTQWLHYSSPTSFLKINFNIMQPEKWEMSAAKNMYLPAFLNKFFHFLSPFYLSAAFLCTTEKFICIVSTRHIKK